MSEMIERVANAMEEAAIGFTMNLTRLVDGVSTYSLKYSDGESLEFESTDELYEHVANKKRRSQARAAIEAMREPTEAQLEAAEEIVVGYDDFACGDGNIYLGIPGHPQKARDVWAALVDAALKEGK